MLSISNILIINTLYSFVKVLKAKIVLNIISISRFNSDQGKLPLNFHKGLYLYILLLGYIKYEVKN